MKIILPHKKISKKVNSYKQISKHVQEMRELVKSKFTTGYWSSALAISHAQVSQEPYSFFVTHPKMKILEHDVIINPVIINKDTPTTFKEACMSYPFRPEIAKQRFKSIRLKFEYKGLFGLKSVTVQLKDIHALIAQHEVDHSNGKCIYD